MSKIKDGSHRRRTLLFKSNGAVTHMTIWLLFNFVVISFSTQANCKFEILIADIRSIVEYFAASIKRKMLGHQNDNTLAELKILQNKLFRPVNYATFNEERKKIQIQFKMTLLHERHVIYNLKPVQILEKCKQTERCLKQAWTFWRAHNSLNVLSNLRILFALNLIGIWSSNNREMHYNVFNVCSFLCHKMPHLISNQILNPQINHRRNQRTIVIQISRRKVATNTKMKRSGNFATKLIICTDFFSLVLN